MKKAITLHISFAIALPTAVIAFRLYIPCAASITVTRNTPSRLINIIIVLYTRVTSTSGVLYILFTVTDKAIAAGNNAVRVARTSFASSVTEVGCVMFTLRTFFLVYV